MTWLMSSPIAAGPPFRGTAHLLRAEVAYPAWHRCRREVAEVRSNAEQGTRRIGGPPMKTRVCEDPQVFARGRKPGWPGCRGRASPTVRRRNQAGAARPPTSLASSTSSEVPPDPSRCSSAFPVSRLSHDARTRSARIDGWMDHVDLPAGANGLLPGWPVAAHPSGILQHPERRPCALRRLQSRPTSQVHLRYAEPASQTPAPQSFSQPGHPSHRRTGHTAVDPARMRFQGTHNTAPPVPLPPAGWLLPSPPPPSE
jgi:hypothetical protein